MDSLFSFKQFSVSNWRSALKVGTDAVLLGSLIEVPKGCRRALDIGTGTGVIALMVAQKESQINITGIDIDEPSCVEAGENFKNSPWSENLDIIKTRLQDFHPLEKYELVFSNPPFFENSLKNPDGREMSARHTDSLSFREICVWCKDYLSDKGTLWIILPYDQMLNTKRIAASFGLKALKQITVFSTPKKPAKRVVFAFSKTNTVETDQREIILNENGTRSDEYKKLTEDYLL